MSQPDHDPELQEIRELLDFDHPRASMSDGERLALNPGAILDNIQHAMERIDLDIDTEVSFGEDIATYNEMFGMVNGLRMGPLLAVHVVNNAMRIMSARYPAELVAAPFPDRFDLREVLQLTLTDPQHALAKAIFDRRSTSPADLAIEEVSAELDPLAVDEQIAVIIALFYMYGVKVGALKHRTGIQ